MFGMKNVFCVMLLLPLLFQSSFSLSLFKHLFSHLSTGAMQSGAGSTAMKTDTGSTAMKTGTGSTAMETGASSTAMETGAGSTAMETGTGSTAMKTGAGSTPMETGASSTAMKTGAGSTPMETSASSTAMETGAGSTAMKTGAGSTPKTCVGNYLINVSLAGDKKSTIVESIFLNAIGKIDATELVGCAVIQGDLIINGVANKNAGDVDTVFYDYPLDVILGKVQEVTGSVCIYDTLDLSAIVKSLSSLETIGKNLAIEGNANLGSGDIVFSTLTSIVGGVTVDGNPGLVSTGDTSTLLKFPKFQHIKVRGSNADKVKSGAGSTAMETGAGSSPKTCVGNYLITVSLASDKKSTIVESIFLNDGTSESANEIFVWDFDSCDVIKGHLIINGVANNNAGDVDTVFDDYPLDVILGKVQEVTGSVYIFDTPDLSAIVKSLSSLETIGKDLAFDGNKNLGSGHIVFNTLTIIVGGVTVDGNPSSLSLLKHLFSHLSTGAMETGAGSTTTETVLLISKGYMV